MDAQAKKKALFRAKLNAQKKDKRIDSPLVRYNESDQPVCRVCNVLLKSESNWDAHQASRKHHEAIANLKANAAGVNKVNKTKSESSMGTTTSQSQQSRVEPSTKLSKSQTASGLPPNFFDSSDTTKPKTDAVTSGPLPVASAKNSQPLKQISGPEIKQAKRARPEGFFDEEEIDLASSSVKHAELGHSSKPSTGSEIKKEVKGALPEGFFDNKEADLLARGIKPVKLDIKDEYKEFEKLIQGDLQVMDNRMEEEEVDAADDIEEEEQVEQRSYMERVEMLKRKKMDRDAALSTKRKKVSDVSSTTKEQKDEDSSSDDDKDGHFSVDWRAQHF